MMDSDTGLAAYNELATRDLVKKINELRAAGARIEMPRYKCHKEVWAPKIADIKDPTEPGSESDGSRIIVPADAGFAPFLVKRGYVQKQKPKIGGYYVVYADGYKSYSPAKVFDEGYSRIP